MEAFLSCRMKIDVKCDVVFVRLRLFLKREQSFSLSEEQDCLQLYLKLVWSEVRMDRYAPMHR